MKTNPKILFIACCVALTATAMTFAIRANLMSELGAEFGLSSSQMGIVTGTAFWGFTLSMLLGGFLYNTLGIRKIILIAFLGHVLGVVLTILSSGFWSLFISTLCVGLANGLVEAACNPLVSQLYPHEKTKRLNQFHIWFPGGIVIGGILAYVLQQQHAGWQLQMALILIPALVYGFLFFQIEIPETKNENENTNWSHLFSQCKKPLFILMVICMLFTAATELGTNQWIVALLENQKIPAILLLVYINGLMILGRSFAGKIEQKLSPVGMLFFSAVCSAIGLYLLGSCSNNYIYLAASVFGVGICFFWPTMLGFVAEYLPETGAVGLSIMGAAGMLSVSLILPFMGDLFDFYTLSQLPNGIELSNIVQSEDPGLQTLLKEAKLIAGATTLKTLSVLPISLSVVFGILFYKRTRKI